MTKRDRPLSRSDVAAAHACAELAKKGVAAVVVYVPFGGSPADVGVVGNVGEPGVLAMLSGSIDAVGARPGVLSLDEFLARGGDGAN